MSGRRGSTRRGVRLAAYLFFLAGVIAAAGARAESPKRPADGTTKVDFEQQILPIFKVRCFECHGPKEREARLRLDVRRIVFAGSGIKGGVTVGKTDELGYYPAEDSVSMHDLHATILHLLGMDHERLTFKFQGRDYRLTDIAGDVVKKVVA